MNRLRSNRMPHSRTQGPLAPGAFAFYPSCAAASARRRHGHGARGTSALNGADGRRATRASDARWWPSSSARHVPRSQTGRPSRPRPMRPSPRSCRPRSANSHPLLDPLAQPIRELQLELRPREAWGLDSAEIVAHGPVRLAAADSPHGRRLSGTRRGSRQRRVLGAHREAPRRRLARAADRPPRVALAETSRRVHLLERSVVRPPRPRSPRIEATLEEREEQLRHRRLLARPAGSG